MPPAGDEAPPVAPDADVIQMPVVPPGGPDGAGVMDLSPQESSGSVKGPSLLDIAMKAEGIKRLPVPVLPEDAPLAKRWLWWLLLLIYLYFALSLHAISRKTKTARVWLSWIPLANIYQMCKIAGKPAKWCWLFLIPLANIVVAVIVWMNIAKAVNKPSWIGILLIIPIVNILLPGYLALSK